jgi:hypothetical protein
VRRRWSPDTLSVRPNLYVGKPCRVCGVPVALGEDVHTFHWREERGCAHVVCGFWNLADVDPVACARRLLALKPGQPVPRALADEAIANYLARRMHRIGGKTEIVATTIGVALMKRLREQPAMKQVANGS